MNYIIAGNWIEWAEYVERHQLKGARYVTHPSQLPDIRRKGDTFHLIGTHQKRARNKALLEHIKENLILNG